MSKISPTLKALIDSPHARPNTTPPPPYIRDVYTRILLQGKQKQYGLRPSIALAVRSSSSPFFLSSLLPLLSSTNLYVIGSNNIHPQLASIPRSPALHLVLPLPLPHATLNSRAHPRDRAQVHLLQRHTENHQLPGGVQVLAGHKPLVLPALHRGLPDRLGPERRGDLEARQVPLGQHLHAL